MHFEKHLIFICCKSYISKLEDNFFIEIFLHCNDGDTFAANNHLKNRFLKRRYQVQKQPKFLMFYKNRTIEISKNAMYIQVFHIISLTLRSLKGYSFSKFLNYFVSSTKNFLKISSFYTALIPSKIIKTQLQQSSVSFDSFC